MSSSSSQPNHRRRPTLMRGAVLCAALSGLTAMLSACAADEGASAGADAPALALFSEGQWVSGGLNKPIPSTAFQGGFEKGEQNVYFICRAKRGGDLLPGKLFSGRCHVGWQGDELHFDSYEILVDPARRLSWAWIDKPKNAVVGGHENGKTVYICRGSDHVVREDINNSRATSAIPGKLVDGVCYATYDGDENAYTGSKMQQLDMK